MREEFRRRKAELACKTQSAREESQTKRRQFWQRFLGQRGSKLLAKNELRLLEVSVPEEDVPVPANGNEQEVVSEPVWLTSEPGR
jgi:hypothetical protein